MSDTSFLRCGCTRGTLGLTFGHDCDGYYIHECSSCRATWAESEPDDFLACLTALFAAVTGRAGLR